jgi:hypothetical protein
LVIQGGWRRNRTRAAFARVNKRPQKTARYCFKRPQYLCAPLSQQLVLRQIDIRVPQFVTQIDSVERSGFFLQLLMQMVSSPLQRIGMAMATCVVLKIIASSIAGARIP